MEYKSLEDFQNAYPDEESARRQMIEWRWGKFASCPYCGNEKCYMIKERNRFICAAKRTCGKKFSVTVKTLLEDTKLEPQKWLHAFYLYSKSRARISSFDLAKDLEIPHKTEFHLREKLDFAWQFVNRDNKNQLEIIKDLFLSCVYSYDRFNDLQHNPYKGNPYHISEIDNISDPKQYNKLVRYTRYYINVYCFWIFMDFADPEEILTETFLWMRENDIIEYNAESIIKYIQKTVNNLWAKFLNEHPRHANFMSQRVVDWKREARLFLRDSYIVELIASQKGNVLTRKEIRKRNDLVSNKRRDVLAKRGML